MIKNRTTAGKIQQEERECCEHIGEAAELDKSLIENQKLFIENMTHEMRTPVTAILAFAELLSLKPDITDEERKEYLEYICEEARRLKNMSKKLSTLILFQGMHDVQKEELSLKELINEVLKTEQLICREEGLLFETELDECKIEGEKDFLKSLFYNLIDNAIKASKQNGKILVRMKYEEKEQIKIQVIDNGAGIPKEEIPRITEPFYTVERSVSKKPRGMGLGLPLCQRIIEYHNGELEIESQPGKGSTFTVRLPI